MLSFVIASYFRFVSQDSKTRVREGPTRICHGDGLRPLVTQALLNRGHGGQHAETDDADEDGPEVGGPLAGGPADVPQGSVEESWCRVECHCVVCSEALCTRRISSCTSWDGRSWTLFP